MLSTLKELQDLLYQDWFLMKEPDVDEEGYYPPEADVFTGEIVSHTTGDHICFCEPSAKGEAMAEMILAAHKMYTNAVRLTDPDEYMFTAETVDKFRRSFEEFILKNAGW